MHSLEIWRLENVAVPLTAFTVPFVTTGDPPQGFVVIVRVMLEVLEIRFPY